MVPDLAAVTTAWRDLPPETRDRIGLIAVDMVFQSFVSGAAHGREDRPVPGESDTACVIRERADTAANDRLTELHKVIEDAIPDLFGPAGENPDWAVAMGARR